MDNNQSASIISMTTSCLPHKKASRGAKCVDCCHWPASCSTKPLVSHDVFLSSFVENSNI